MKPIRTPQAIFDQVVEHLLTQGKRSVLDDGLCAYRKEDGSKCAVGCLIPDENYYEGLEGGDAYRNDVIAALPFIADEEIKILLYHLQDIHDTDEPYLWREALMDLAGELPYITWPTHNYQGLHCDE